MPIRRSSVALLIGLLCGGGELLVGCDSSSARPGEERGPGLDATPTRPDGGGGIDVKPSTDLKPGELQTLSSVSQHGITWTFDKPVPVGRFVNGDFYVVGAVTITAIDPKPLWGAEVGPLIDQSEVKESSYPGKQARNGSVLNADKMEYGGYDSRIPSGRYAPEEFSPLPIGMKPGDALISTISRANSEITKFSGQHVDPLRTAAVLTCLAAAQPEDAFRPSYVDTKNSKIYLARDLDLGLLLNLVKATSMPATLDTYVEAFQRPWLDTTVFGFAAPVDNMPHYGQQMVELEGEASLLLLMSYPAEQKRKLLVNLVQVGIDFAGLVRLGKTYYGHGGLHSGRKWPIVLAGILLGDKALQSAATLHPKANFAEDNQTALCPYAYDGKTFPTGWTGAKAVFTGHSPWWLASTISPSLGAWDTGWGPVDLVPPSEWKPKDAGKPPFLAPDDLPASEGYRRANTSPAWVAQALAMRMMHQESVWNHDGFFAYVDRWMTEDDTPFVTAIRDAACPDCVPNPTTCVCAVDYTKTTLGKFMRQQYISGGTSSSIKWVRELWGQYRDKLPAPADGHQDPAAATTWK